jgi:hypothetical protein
VVGVLFSCKVDEYLSAAWQRKPGPAFLNQLNERAIIFRMTCRENISWFSLVSNPPTHCCNSLSTQQQTPQQLRSKNKNRTKLHPKKQRQLTHRLPRTRSAKHSAKRSLVTFFGFGKKVTRLSAGTDGFNLY